MSRMVTECDPISIAAKEEEIISLSAKLEEMQKLIKSYETLLAQESRQDGAA